MSYLTKLKLNGVEHIIRDAAAYKAINILNGDSSVIGSVANSIKISLADLKRNSFKVVDSLPDPQEAEDGVIYLIQEEGTKSGSYIEYIKIVNIGGEVALEKIGSTDMDLSDYQTRVDTTELAKKILEVNEFNVTDDLVERSGYTYITLHNDGTSELGINRTDDNVVYVRENIVYQTELKDLQNEVNEFKLEEKNDIDTINARIDVEIDTLNQQTGLSSYVTIEKGDSDNIGTINIVDVNVLQPKTTRIETDISWYDESATTFNLTSPSELLGLSQLVKSNIQFEGKTISINNDIDMKGQEFPPIGRVQTQNNSKPIYEVSEVGTKVFKGTFDGHGHTIYNLRISQNVGTNWDNVGIGLFGTVANGSTIKNINVHNVSIDSPQGNFVGVIAGYIPNSPKDHSATTIENCNITGTIKINGRIGVGAILGRAEEGAVVNIRNCTVIGIDPKSSVISAALKNNFATVGAITGGLYGQYENVIDGCTVKNLTITSSNEANGGIVGHFERGTISNNTIQNVVVADTTDTNVYMQEAVTVGAILGTMDRTITASNVANPRVTLDNNTLNSITIVIPKTYTNSGNASGVELDSNGYPNWVSWPVIGTPKKVESRDPSPFVTLKNCDWTTMRQNITVRKV